MTIDIRNLDSIGIVIHTQEWPDGAQDRAFANLITEVLLARFLDKPVCFVSASSQGVAFAQYWRATLHAVKRGARFGGMIGGHWLGFADSCPEEVLRDVVTDDDFDLGRLWVTSIPESEVERADRLLAVREFHDTIEPAVSFHPGRVPKTNEEVILLTDDSRALVWINPDRAFDDVVDLVVPKIAAGGLRLGAIVTTSGQLEG